MAQWQHTVAYEPMRDEAEKVSEDIASHLSQVIAMF